MTIDMSSFEIDNLIKKLVTDILASNKEPIRMVLGIPRGGMPVAYAVAREIEKRKADWPDIQVARAPKDAPSQLFPNSIVIDDIVDTGRTIEPYVKAGFKTGVLITQADSIVHPDYTGTISSSDEWVSFPWDEASKTPEDAVVRILEYLGLNPLDPSLLETPRRFLSWMSEFRVNQEEPEITTFEGVHYDQMVIVRNIPFISLCEHHLLPFMGVGAVAYIPSPEGAVIGLSKLARIVQYYGKRPQVQERMTQQILESVLAATGTGHAGVVIKAEHMCMSLRGPQAKGHETITSALYGEFRSDSKTREEFLNLASVH